jgi:PAS domain S-box-containing protein
MSVKLSISKGKVDLPDEIIKGWQELLNSIVQLSGLPPGLIARTGSTNSSGAESLPPIESSNTSNEINSRQSLAGQFFHRTSETGPAYQGPEEKRLNNSVQKTGEDTRREHHLNWSDGEVFGSNLLPESLEMDSLQNDETLLSMIKDSIETHLAAIYQDNIEKRILISILDCQNDGILVLNKDQRIIFFNRTAETITGFSREDVLNKNCNEVFGTSFYNKVSSLLINTSKDEESNHTSVNILTKKGESKRLEMVLNSSGETAGSSILLVLSFRDITDTIGLKIRQGRMNSFAGIVGRSEKMLQIYRQIQNLSTTDYPVHITGGTGTGKELVAKAIHNESKRSSGPFVPVNCGALPEGLIESELFGHVKGAFTGAVRDKKGRFELAHDGTLFLDEVADLPKGMQVKLLRVVQENKFERVGDEKTTSVDVRIISATNRDLKEEVERGNFREDLYYRINVVPIHLPLLRERRDDIPLLIGHLLPKALEEGQETPGISRKAMDTLTAYRWPGNIRELQSVLRFAYINSKGRIIEPDDLPSELNQEPGIYGTRGPVRKLNSVSVESALLRSGGNKVKAAKILGVGRATLYRFLNDTRSVS